MRDAAASARKLATLKALGVRIAIDDFGIGYSSLGYLQQFPVDALKIDRSFISRLAANPESAALIHTMIQLGKALGVETLAEGIEEPTTQLLSLLQEHCDSGQGFLLARPLTPAALGAWTAGYEKGLDQTGVWMVGWTAAVVHAKFASISQQGLSVKLKGSRSSGSGRISFTPAAGSQLSRT
jgi:predicted signal transduction protein with EAL and GGDEF domain